MILHYGHIAGSPERELQEHPLPTPHTARPFLPSHQSLTPCQMNPRGALPAVEAPVFNYFALCNSHSLLHTRAHTHVHIQSACLYMYLIAADNGLD